MEEQVLVESQAVSVFLCYFHLICNIHAQTEQVDSLNSLELQSKGAQVLGINLEESGMKPAMQFSERAIDLPIR